AARGFLKKPCPAPDSFPAVTLLKPLHGAEPGLAENLASFCKQDYPGPIQLVIGIQSPSDAAIRIAEGLKNGHPEIDITLVIDPRQGGSNPKVANLLNMMPHAKHHVLVLSDSDIGVEPHYLRVVISTLQQGAGAVSCCYVGKPLDNFWSRLSA